MGGGERCFRLSFNRFSRIGTMRDCDLVQGLSNHRSHTRHDTSTKIKKTHLTRPCATNFIAMTGRRMTGKSNIKLILGIFFYGINKRSSQLANRCLLILPHRARHISNCCPSSQMQPTDTTQQTLSCSSLPYTTICDASYEASFLVIVSDIEAVGK